MPRIFGGQDARKAFQKGTPDLAKRNTVCYLQVLGLGTDCDDASPSVLLFFDMQRYLFNAGEGFQRFCVEHKVKINRISSCLLTRLDGQASGGLAGMCLTMADAEGPNSKPLLDVVGPKGLGGVAASIRSIVSQYAVGIRALEFGNPGAGLQSQREQERDENGVLLPVVQNALVTITPVMLISPKTPISPEDPIQTDDPTNFQNPSAPQNSNEAQNPISPQNPVGAETPTGTKNHDEAGNSPGQNERDGDEEPVLKKARTDAGPEPNPLPSPPPGIEVNFTVNGPIQHEPSEPLTAACYIAELANVAGKFLPKKAFESGVPQGKAFAQLKNGQSFTLADGTVIEPSQVNEPSQPGPVAIIADCPDASYLPSFTSDPTWQRFYTDSDMMTQQAERKLVDVIVHLARSEVVELGEYQAWVARFGETTKHIYVNSKATKAATIMASSATIQARLNCLHPEVFPLHYRTEQQPYSIASEPKMLVEPKLQADSAPTPGGGETGVPSEEAETCPPVQTPPVAFVRAGGKAMHSKHAPGGRSKSASFGSPGAPKVQPFSTAETNIAGQNMLKFHLRPPSRKGCFDLSEVSDPIDWEGIRGKVKANKALMSGLAEAKANGLAVNTNRGCSGNARLSPHPQEAQDHSDDGLETSDPPTRPITSQGSLPIAPESTADDSADSKAHEGLINKLGSECMEITFLGTGAAVPSKYRNVTGIYLNFFAHGGMLLDCGEGSLGQLIRRFGPKAKEVVCGLKCIWISHIHSDHHAGVTRILTFRRQLLGKGCKPLLVIGPRSLHRTLVAWSLVQPVACHFIDISTTVNKHPGPREEHNKAAIREALESMEMEILESCTVHHCSNAYGLSLTSKAGWKIAFSGDTRPCRNIVHAAQNALLLIHEATFEDSLESEALSKLHSTTCEAVEVGQKAKAYRTILTHFSQRYPKIPVIEPSFRTTTCIAFDLMAINITDLPMLPWLVQPISQLFQPMDFQMETEPAKEIPAAEEMVKCDPQTAAV